MASPAGWYDDGAGSQRWWDGTAWTERVRPPEQASSGSASTKSSTAGGPLRTFQGTNAEGEVKVSIFRDRLEWDQNAGSGYSGGKIAAGVLTGGPSLLATGVGKGSYGRTRPTKSILPLDSVTGIASRHEGWQTAVTVSTPSMAVTWKMRKKEAREVVQLLRELVDKSRAAPAPPPPQSVAVNILGDAKPVAGTRSADPLAGLNRLVKLHADGILSDAEFSAAKAELLGL